MLPLPILIENVFMGRGLKIGLVETPEAETGIGTDQTRTRKF